MWSDLDAEDVARIDDELSELGVGVVNTKIIEDTVTQPFNHFGKTLVDEDDRER